MKIFWRMVILFWTLTIVMVGVLLYQPASRPAASHPGEKTSADPSPATSLKWVLRVGFTGEEFAVVNMSPFKVKGITLTLNPGIFGGGYLFGLTSLGPQEMRVIPSRSFQKSNGVRYSVLREEPKYMSATGQSEDGEELRTGLVNVTAIR